MDAQIEQTEKKTSHSNLYRLPKMIEHQGEDALKLSEERRIKWLSRISREDLKDDPQKLKQIRVYSDHFVSGKSCDLTLIIIHLDHRPCLPKNPFTCFSH